MTSRHAIHAPGLCDAAEAEAFHLPPRPRWLTPAALRVRRISVVLISAAAGFALAWLVKP